MEYFWHFQKLFMATILRIIRRSLDRGFGWSDIYFNSVLNINNSTWWNADEISGAGLVCIDGSFPSFPTRKSWEPLQLARGWVLLLPANLVRITNSEENYTYDEQGALLKRFSKMLKITYWIYWTCTLQDLSRPCSSNSRLLGIVSRQVCNVPGDDFWTK